MSQVPSYSWAQLKGAASPGASQRTWGSTRLSAFLWRDFGVGGAGVEPGEPPSRICGRRCGEASIFWGLLQTAPPPAPCYPIPCGRPPSHALLQEGRLSGGTLPAPREASGARGLRAHSAHAQKPRGRFRGCREARGQRRRSGVPAQAPGGPRISERPRRLGDSAHHLAWAPLKGATGAGTSSPVAAEGRPSSASPSRWRKSNSGLVVPYLHAQLLSSAPRVL